ncbi:hypothetical protein EXIGLDRAFT_160757 [Exidia glandulosa HHB12029]|uniref:Uncharacterized protein n=1 Tax=Exidia glandulosa HHB12029 TaxID=1314781 RepID=A0A165FIM6_EXIGL|nr:hypothetical protein EXIGLDRAFT_160757 [Exidia glandulosa HHB12029]
MKQVMKFLDEYEAKGLGKRHKVCLWIRRFWSNDDHQEELDELKRRFAAALDKLSFVSGVEISQHVRALQHNFSLRMEKVDRMLHKIMKSVTDLPNNGLNKKAASQFMNGLLQNLVDELDTKQKSQRTYQRGFLTDLDARLQHWRDADETKLTQKQEEWLQRLIDDMNERRRVAEQSRLDAQERLLQEITTGHDGSTQALRDAHQRLMDHINDRRMEDDERLNYVRNDIAQVITAANQALHERFDAERVHDRNNFNNLRAFTEQLRDDVAQIMARMDNSELRQTDHFGALSELPILHGDMRNVVEQLRDDVARVTMRMEGSEEQQRQAIDGLRALLQQTVLDLARIQQSGQGREAAQEQVNVMLANIDQYIRDAGKLAEERKVRPFLH